MYLSTQSVNQNAGKHGNKWEHWHEMGYSNSEGLA